MWKHSFCARHPLNFEAQAVQNDTCSSSYTDAFDPTIISAQPEPSRNGPAADRPHPSSEARFVLQSI